MADLSSRSFSLYMTSVAACLIVTMKDFSITRFSLLLSFAALLVVIVKVIILIWWKPRKIEQHFAKQGIRGPPYRLFIGNGIELVRLMVKASSQPMSFSHNILPRVLAFYHHWKKIYGGTFLVWFGPTPRLTVSDPELIREIFGSKSSFYEKTKALPVLRMIEGEGLLSLEGERWSHRRKLISPTFHMEHLKLLIPDIAKKVLEMIESWEGRSDETEVEVSEWFQTLTEDVASRTAFGNSYKDGKGVIKLHSQLMVLGAEAFRKLYIPGLRFLPTRNNMMSWRLNKEIVSSVTEIVRRRKQDCIEGGSSKDLLTLLMKSVSKTTRQGAETNAPTCVRAEDIVGHCKEFVFAGKSTTSNMLTWTTVLLAMHPEWQARAREEVTRVCGSRGIPSAEQIAKLKTLGMIVNEALRLYPPIVATIRRSKVDVELGPYKIPGGTELLIPILAIHHDPALWGQDAAMFNPDRFQNGVTRAARHPLSFMPFGLGARTCIGQNLAVLQAKVAIAVLLQRFSFSLSLKYRHAPTVLMLLYPQHGAPVVFRSLPGSERSSTSEA